MYLLEVVLVFVTVSFYVTLAKSTAPAATNKPVEKPVSHNLKVSTSLAQITKAISGGEVGKGSGKNDTSLKMTERITKFAPANPKGLTELCPVGYHHDDTSNKCQPDVAPVFESDEDTFITANPISTTAPAIAVSTPDKESAISAITTSQSNEDLLDKTDTTSTTPSTTDLSSDTSQTLESSVHERVSDSNPSNSKVTPEPSRKFWNTFGGPLGIFLLVSGLILAVIGSFFVFRSG